MGNDLQALAREQKQESCKFILKHYQDARQTIADAMTCDEEERATFLAFASHAVDVANVLLVRLNEEADRAKGNALTDAMVSCLREQMETLTNAVMRNAVDLASTHRALLIYEEGL